MSTFGFTTLFLGDLSIYCEEKDIFELARRYGPVESIQIKRTDDGQVRKPHLSYGFVKFVQPESAEAAFSSLNGVVFLGRALRIGWATNNGFDRVIPPLAFQKPPTAQVHITFLCPLDKYPVTEDKLRRIFEVYGKVVDVTINRAEVNKVNKVAFSFLSYFLFPLNFHRKLLFIQVLDLSIMS
jgi:RNA recognition motif-containing protein